MNRVMRENYPVSRLPEDLRAGFESEDVVDIVVRSRRQKGNNPDEAIGGDGQTPDILEGEVNLGGQFSRFKHVKRSNYGSADEINAYVNGLRDEWAHRER